MAQKYPAAFYTCPCTDITKPQIFPQIQHAGGSRPGTRDGASAQNADAAEEEEEQGTFDPHTARANHALYPLEHLLFCYECHEIRCPACYFEEVLYYYCPHCLFENPSSVVKTESNRCTRSCFQCPACTAALTIVTTANTEQTGPNSSEGTRFILSCPHCTWSTLECSPPLTFDKPVNICGQLTSKLKSTTSSSTDALHRAKSPLSPSTSIDMTDRDGFGAALHSSDAPQAPTPSSQFAQLAHFYKTQISDSTPSGPYGLGGQSFGLESPSQLSRLLSTFGVSGLRKQRGKLPLMREALSTAEGLRPHSSLSQHSSADPDPDALTIQRMRSAGWSGSTSLAQRHEQSLLPLHQYQHTTSSPYTSAAPTPSARFIPSLLPVPTPLRSKRAKRCKTCRNNIARLEQKALSTRYKIRLLALNHIPTITIRPLLNTESSTLAVNLAQLAPARAVQFLLTFRNPLFDPVKVALATPRVTPGKIQNRVTLLCPQFDISANSEIDAFDEALNKSAGNAPGTPDAGQGVQAQPEPGKIWSRARNSTTVVLEVVPGDPGVLRGGAGVFGGGVLAQREQVLNTNVVDADNVVPSVEEKNPNPNDDPLAVEIPVFVRLEYEMDDTAGSGSAGPTGAGSKDRGAGVGKQRELAYWVVLSVGRLREG